MPKVAHPDTFPEAVRLAVERSIDAEVLIPFESERQARLFRARVYDYARAHRAHQTPMRERLASMSVKFYTTIDVRGARPEWKPGPLFPFTLIIDSRTRFEANIANMQVIEEPTAPPLRSNIKPSHHTLPPLDDDAPEYADDDDETRTQSILDILHGDDT